GPDATSNLVIANPIPAGITGFSWTGSNGSSGTDIALNDAIGVLPAGSSIVYTITLDAPAAFTGNLTSTTNYTMDGVDPVFSCPQCSDTDVNIGADIVIVNSNGQTNYTPGTTTIYTVTVTNN